MSSIDPSAWTPVAELGYEQARDELVEVVGVLESKAVWTWTRPEAVGSAAKHWPPRCEEHLAGARERIEAVLHPDDEGIVSGAPTATVPPRRRPAPMS